MEKKRELIAIAAACALFVIACAAVFIASLAPRSGYEILSERPATEMHSEPPAADKLVDINRATVEELVTLPGIGRSLAERIVDYREQNGGFGSPADIMQVKGIGEGIYSNIADYITAKEADG